MPSIHHLVIAKQFQNAHTRSVFSTKGLPMLVLSLICALSAHLSAQVLAGGLGIGSLVDAGGPPSYLPIIGGPGGGAYKALCGAGAFLTGFELHTGDDVDAIRPVCKNATAFFTLTDWHGGNGGGPTYLRCPLNLPVVLALDVAAEGAKTVIVNNIHLFCGSATGNLIPPAYPTAVFDGPGAHPSSSEFPILPIDVPNGMSSPTPIGRTSGHEACPPGQRAIGIHGASGIWLDSVGLICAAPPAPPPPRFDPRVPVKSIGRVNTGPTPPRVPGSTICDSAKDARSRNSPAAPNLEAQCNALIAANEKADLAPGASGVPISVCDAAQSALDRNAPESDDLSAKCRATGGGQHLVSQASKLASSGRDAATADPLLAELRRTQPTGPFRHGFDVGIATTGADTQWGPGKQRILDSLPPAEQEGFKVSSSFVLDRNRNAQLAAVGATIAANDPDVAAARTKDPDVRYWLGFDIASGIFGDPAQGAQGNRAIGPGSNRIRDALSLPAQRGYNASVTLHLSRTY
jgi:hypothetical protein